MIKVLAETAYEHQIPALRYALRGHIARATSLRVEIGSLGLPVFQLHFQIHYHAFRPGTFLGKTPNDRKPRDMSAVTLRPSFLHQRHIALTICGLGDKRWTAYLFTDAYFDGGRAGAGDDSATTSDVELVNCSDEKTVGGREGGKSRNENQNVNEQSSSQAHPAQTKSKHHGLLPENAREYFLTAVAIQMGQVLTEVRALVKDLQRGIDDASCRFPHLLLAVEPELQQFQHLEQAHEWTIRALKALNMLRNNLDDVIKAWKSFQHPETGDINYFEDLLSDTTPLSHVCTAAFLNIYRHYEEFSRLKNSTTYMIRKCEDYKASAEIHRETMSLRVAVQSGKALERSFWMTSYAVDAVLIPAQIAIGTGFLAILFPLTPTSSSFLTGPLRIFVHLLGWRCAQICFRKTFPTAGGKWTAWKKTAKVIFPDSLLVTGMLSAMSVLEKRFPTAG